MNKIKKGWKIKRKPVLKEVLSRTYYKASPTELGIKDTASFHYEAKLGIDYLPDDKFIFFIPDFLSMMLSCTESQIMKAEDIQKKFKDSRKIKNSINLSIKQDQILDDLIISLVPIPISMYSALETFANQQIFYGKTFFSHPGWKVKDGVFYDYFGAQRYLSLEEKIFNLIPAMNLLRIDKKINDRAKEFVSNLVKIRNNVVHQKITSGEENPPKLIKDLLSTDWKLFLDEIKIIIQKYKGHCDGIPEDLTKIKK